jgi:hypothetical protein
MTDGSWVRFDLNPNRLHQCTAKAKSITPTQTNNMPQQFERLPTSAMSTEALKEKTLALHAQTNMTKLSFEEQKKKDIKELHDARIESEKKQTEAIVAQTQALNEHAQRMAEQTQAINRFCDLIDKYNGVIKQK